MKIMTIIGTTGNLIFEVIAHFDEAIRNSGILQELSLAPSSYILVTAHRAENVDDPTRLSEIFRGLHLIAERLKMRIICSIHPRTRDPVVFRKVVNLLWGGIYYV